MPCLASGFVARAPVSSAVGVSRSHVRLGAGAIKSASASPCLETSDLPHFDLPLESTMTVTQLIYNFAELRRIVDDHEETFNLHLSADEKKKRKLVAFDTPALIDTRNCAEDKFPAAKMRNPVTAIAIAEFLRRTTGYFRQGRLDFNPVFVEDGDDESPVYMASVLEDLAAEFDGEIVEFDDKLADEGLNTQLVYSVIVNRSSKQIIVVFRGTVNLKDALVDLTFIQTSRDIVNEVTDRKAELHKGFADYLIGDEEYSKLKQILAVLRQVYAYKGPEGEYKDYKMMVTGHSLGGCLAQLSSFLFAGLDECDFIPKPVTAVTWASPVVGDRSFYEAYRDLEEAGRVRHIRVSNERDIVPGTPGFSLRQGYTQTGVNIHLREKGEAEVGYENTKSAISQFNPFENFGNHFVFPLPGSNGSYYERLFAKEGGKFVNGHVLGKTVDELYEEHANLGSSVAP